MANAWKLQGKHDKALAPIERAVALGQTIGNRHPNPAIAMRSMARVLADYSAPPEAVAQVAKVRSALAAL